jgi:hypothetical protein
MLFTLEGFRTLEEILGLACHPVNATKRAPLLTTTAGPTRCSHKEAIMARPPRSPPLRRAHDDDDDDDDDVLWAELVITY